MFLLIFSPDLSQFDFHLTLALSVSSSLVFLPPSYYPYFLFFFFSGLGLTFHHDFLCFISFLILFLAFLPHFSPLSLKHCEFLNISLLHPVKSLAPFCLFSSSRAFSLLLKLQLQSSFLSSRSSCLFSHFITSGTRIKYALVCY